MSHWDDMPPMSRHLTIVTHAIAEYEDWSKRARAGDEFTFYDDPYVCVSYQVDVARPGFMAIFKFQKVVR
jgi:hypothetical protein